MLNYLLKPVWQSINKLNQHQKYFGLIALVIITTIGYRFIWDQALLTLVITMPPTLMLGAVWAYEIPFGVDEPTESCGKCYSRTNKNKTCKHNKIAQPLLIN